MRLFIAGATIALLGVTILVALQDDETSAPLVTHTPAATATSTATVAPSPTATAAALGCLGDYASLTDDGVERSAATDVVRFLTDFMEARVGGDGAETCLTQDALDAYEEGSAETYDPEADPGPLCLYACGEVEVVEFVVEEGAIAQADAHSFEASVRIVLEADGERYEDADFFTFGVGTNAAGESKDLVIRSVSSAAR